MEPLDLPVEFVFLREGSSDDGLLPHLRELLIEAGATEVVGRVPNLTGSVRKKVATLISSGPVPHVIFIHRDSDGPDPERRRNEIRSQSSAAGAAHVVPVIPVQTLEAWLLLDPGAIRAVVGNPAGRKPLELPAAGRVESVADPKSVLRAALLQAADRTGQRHQEVRRNFPRHRRLLLERFDRDGPLRDLPSWRQLRDDITELVRVLADERGTRS